MVNLNRMYQSSGNPSIITRVTANTDRQAYRCYTSCSTTFESVKNTTKRRLKLIFENENFNALASMAFAVAYVKKISMSPSLNKFG